MVAQRSNLCIVVCSCSKIVRKRNNSIFTLSLSERRSVQVTKLLNLIIITRIKLSYNIRSDNILFIFFFAYQCYRAVNSRSMGSAANNRRTINQHPKNGPGSDKKRNNATSKHASSENAEEQKMAIVLFFIVALYLGTSIYAVNRKFDI